MFYINGSYVEENAAKISVLDLGLIRGYGVFDYLRTYNKRPFHLQNHLERLRYSAQEIGLNLPLEIEEIASIIETLLEKNGFEESSVKMIVTGGLSPDQLMPKELPSLMIFTYPLKPFSEEHYKNGVKTITTTLSRAIPQSKTLQYIPAIMALKKGLSTNATEALYLNKKNEILEATTSNFFAFKNGVLITPESDELLIGITREVVRALAKDHFKVEMRTISYEEIASLDEAFLTSSNKEVMPVIQIDEFVIGKGVVGENTKKLMHLFREYTHQPLWSPLHIPRYAEEKDSTCCI